MKKLNLIFITALIVIVSVFIGCYENSNGLCPDCGEADCDGFCDDNIVLTLELSAIFHWQTDEPEGFRVEIEPELLADKKINIYDRYSLSIEFKSDTELKEIYFAMIDMTPEVNGWNTLSWITLNEIASDEIYDEVVYFYNSASATSTDPRANVLIIGATIEDLSTITEEDKVILTFTHYDFKEELPMEALYAPSVPTGLPTLYIDTRNREGRQWLQSIPPWNYDWLPADYRLTEIDGSELTGNTNIRARGNSTRWMPKTPYNLNLDSAAAFIPNLPVHRRWALLANYSDKSLLRTETAFKLGAIFDNLEWTSGSRPVDVYLNDDYRGVYQLVENIRAGTDRVNIIPEISSTNPSGGFLLEICARMEDEFHFYSSLKNAPFNCSSPDSNLDRVIEGTNPPITIFQKIQSYINEVEDVLFSDNFKDPVNGWQKYLDMDSFIDFYFVNEITNNPDAHSFSSIYLYYHPVKQKLFMGPLWDFDLSSGNCDYGTPVDQWLMKTSPWYQRLFEDQYFVNAVKMRWNEKKNDVSAITAFIDQRASYLNDAAEHNFNKWLILDKYVWPNKEVTGSYIGEINYLKSWLTSRINWLDTAINGL